MKVLHILGSSAYSGAENIVCEIIDIFKGDIGMAYCSCDGHISKVLYEKEIKFIPLKTLNIKNLNKAIKLYRPDIIHAHDYKASFMVSLCNFKGKIISHLHNNSPEISKLSIKSILYSLTINKYEKIIAVSDSIFKELKTKRGASNKYVVIQNYLNKERILRLSCEGISNEEYDIAFFGRLTLAKNPIMFIELIEEIKKYKPNIKAVMIGEGELRSECEEYILTNSLEKNIQIKGFLINPYPFIKSSELVVMPSKWEGFGLTAIESIILNKPILVSNVGGLKGIFKGSPVSLCNSKGEFLDKVNKFYNDKTFKDELKSCNEKIVDKYTNKEKWKNQLNKLYRGL